MDSIEFIDDDFQQEDQVRLTLKDLLALCISKWKWFVISLAVIMGLTVIYLLRQPNVYTRYTSLLIKEEGRGAKSFASELNSSVGMGMFSNRTNVDNELISIQSPDVVMEVVRRLGLDVNYTTDGTFHRNTLYGRSLPIKVQFKELSYNEGCQFTIKLKENDQLVLSDFKKRGESVGDDVTMKMGQEVNTPVGKLKITASPYYKKLKDKVNRIYVNRKGLLASIGSCRSRMSARLSSKQATIIDISYQDVNIQRAEEFLNTVLRNFSIPLSLSITRTG